jgi:hypothetical protein
VNDCAIAGNTLKALQLVGIETVAPYGGGLTGTLTYCCNGPCRAGGLHEKATLALEQALVVCPLLSPAFQACVKCRQQLTHAEYLGKTIMPLVPTDTFVPRGWLHIIVAGLPWVRANSNRVLEMEQLIRQLVRKWYSVAAVKCIDVLTLEIRILFAIFKFYTRHWLGFTLRTTTLERQ